MNIGVWNILDLAENFGDDTVQELISDFTTGIRREGQKKTLNPDVEVFLKKQV